MLARFFDLSKYINKKKNGAIYESDFCMNLFFFFFFGEGKKKFALISHPDVEFFKSSIS